MTTYLEYRSKLKTLKTRASMSARETKTRDQWGEWPDGEGSDYKIFIEEIWPIFNEITHSSSLTLSEKFTLLSEKYYFYYMDSFYSGPSGSYCAFEIFERERSKEDARLFFEKILELLSNQTHSLEKTPNIFNRIIYQYFFIRSDFYEQIDHFFSYLEKLSITNTLEILKENLYANCPYAKDKVSALLDKLWIKGATIADIVAVYQLWLTSEEFFSLIIKKITQGPWTKKQCQEILDNNPIIITHLINLPNDSEKLEIIEACLEKYTLKNKKLFTLESTSLKKIRQEKTNVLNGVLHEDPLLVEAVIADSATHSPHTSSIQTAMPEARAITDDNNPYLNYELINRTRNTLERVSLLFHPVTTAARVEIPLEVQSYIEKSIAVYKNPETFLDFCYKNRRNEKADFLKELLAYISHHPDNSYKSCVESFKTLHAKRFNDVITGDNTESGNIYRIIMTLLSLDNIKAEEEQIRPSAPPLGQANCFY